MKRAFIFIALIALLGCQQKSEVAAPAVTTAQPAAQSQATAPPPLTSTTATLPPGHPAVAATPSAAPANTGNGTVSGTVEETFNAGGYTYLKLKTSSGEAWAAVRETTVKKGDHVTMSVQMTAEKFESKTLKRTFDKILFGALEAGSTAAPAATSAQQHMSVATPDTTPIKVAKAEGSEAKTVAEIWAAKDSLKDKQVVVRGKVVKFLGGILGKNWIHLRDGSGSADKSDNDLAITTNEGAAVGDVVTITGVVHVDKDFGAGYRYPVIIEEAKISK